MARKTEARSSSSSRPQQPVYACQHDAACMDNAPFAIDRADGRIWVCGRHYDAALRPNAGPAKPRDVDALRRLLATPVPSPVERADMIVADPDAGLAALEWARAVKARHGSPA